MNTLGRHRRPGQHFTKGSPLAYRERLEALYLAEPYIDSVTAALRTGASRAVAGTVQRRLREAGKLPPPRRTRAA